MASIFTKIINREIPAEIVFESDTIIVIKDINPEAKTHLLIIPKEEIPSINDIDENNHELLVELFTTAKNLAKQLGVSEWYKLHFNVWPLAQDVMHIHLHLLSDI